jgi:uncharacterized delta-60 repeat protein
VANSSNFLQLLAEPESRPINLVVPPRFQILSFAIDTSLSARSVVQFPRLIDGSVSRNWEPERHISDQIEDPRNTKISPMSRLVVETHPRMSANTSSDSTTLSWLKLYASNMVRSYDRAQAITTDSHGNIYVTGVSDSTLSFVDIVTFKYSPSGTLLWTRRYTTDRRRRDIPYAIAVDRNDNVYIGGTSFTTATSSDFIILKYDSSGAEQWAARYDGPDSDVDLLSSMVIDTAGNVYAAGGSYSLNTFYDFVTVKYNTNGVRQWVQTYNGLGGQDDGANAIALDDAANVYVTGYSYSGISGDVVTLMYDTQGVLKWTARYDGPGSLRDEAFAVGLDSGRNVFVTGYSYNGPYRDFLTIKYDSTGAEVWNREFDGPLGLDDFASALVVDHTGNVYVGGLCTANSATAFDFGVVKYNSSGTQQWVRFDNPVPRANVAALALDAAQNLIVTGPFTDFLTIKYTPDGSKVWLAQYDGPKHGDDIATCVAVDPSGNVIIAGASEGINTYFDLAVVRYSPTGIQQWVQRYNGIGGSDDHLQGLKVDGHGNSYLAAWSQSYPDSGSAYSILLVKVSAQGDTLWTRRYANAMLAYYDGIALDSIGNLFLAGSQPFNPSAACSVITAKYRADGLLLWSRTYGTPGTSYSARAIGVDRDDNVFVGGGSGVGDGFFMLKYTSGGQLLWHSDFGSAADPVNEISALATDDSGSVTIVGSGALGGRATRWDRNGNREWWTICGGHPRAIAVDDSGHSYITGLDMTAKVSSSGSTLWTKPIGGFSIAVDGSHNAFVAGGTLVKYLPNGDMDWSKSPPDGNSFASVHINECGSIFCGAFDPDVSSSKYDVEGNLHWNLTLPPLYTSPQAALIQVDQADQVHIAGSMVIGGGLFSASYIARIDPIPAISLDKDTLAFGEVNLTCSSVDTLELWSNVCTTTEAYFATSPDSDFIITSLDPPTTPNVMHRFLVRFAPRVAGPRSSAISIVHAASGSTATVQAHGIALGAPPEYSSQSIQFQSTPLGCSNVQTFRVTNRRCTPLALFNVISESLDFVVDPSNASIPPGDSAEFSVRFSPLVLGPRSAHIILGHDQNVTPDTVLVHGTGTGSGTEIAVTDSFGIGWQLISTPVDAPCPLVLVPSYRFSHGYARHDTVESGRGYWNKLKHPFLSFAGEQVATASIAVEQGWNIVGSISVSVPTSSVQSIPPGIIETPLYGFDPSVGYSIAETIHPGHAYWLKSGQSGTLLLSPSSATVTVSRPMLGKDSAAFAAFLEKSCRIFVVDSSGQDRVLYFAHEISRNTRMGALELPPPPPSGTADVRFLSGRLIEMFVDGTQYEPQIQITGMTYPIRLRFELGGQPATFSILVGSTVFAVQDHSEITIPAPPSYVKLIAAPSGQLPSEYSLSQNYPNPFNPSTTIEYSLPVESKVLLSVYNTLGQRVMTLVDKFEGPGFKRVALDASELTSGVYFYRLQAGTFTDSKKLLFMR